MNVLETGQTRQQYLQTQIDRSIKKFAYCKVSSRDACAYRKIIRRDRLRRSRNPAQGPILCLGTRNGREVDLFRLEWFGGLLRYAVRWLEFFGKHAFTSRWGWVESLGRSRADELSDRGVVGVEINPMGARSDVWIGSFDDLPGHWTGRFAVAYSNSFDQSQDPVRTAGEWKRVIRPGGYLIVCFTPQAQPTMTDPIGGLQWQDIIELFGGEMIFYRHRGSQNGYSELILRIE